MTKGEYRVGIAFNPSNNGIVDQIKQKAAELIDLVDAIDVTVGEQPRLQALAMTAFEDGAMWAVKAATKRAPEGEA
jgi:hypothetical protein